VSRLAPTSALLAALGVALAAAPASAQDLPVDPESVGIPQNSAISEQYQAVEQAVEQAVPTPPPTPAVAPEPAPAPPPPAPEPEQYHSETPTNVTVTQKQPSNVNVSIRINSPGDDGPVVQINNAGGKAVVQQVVQAVKQRPASGAPAPKPDDPPPSGLPEDWEWEWDSACFGGAAAAAAAVPRWKWRWSCKAAEQQDLPSPADVIPAMPDVWVPDSVDSVLPPSVLPSSPAGVVPAAPAARPDRPAHPERPPPRVEGATAAAIGDGSGGPPAAGGLVAATAAVPTAVAERVGHAVRTAAEARPAPADIVSLVPPGGGSALGAGSGIGAVASLMLGLWIAVLTTAIVLVVPRLRRRRRSGPAWRLTRLFSPRLERPG